MQTKVQIREDITGLMVSKGNLFLGKKIKIPKRRVDALLQHEIGTHIVTYVNGKAQPFQQFIRDWQVMMNYKRELLF